jgi:hypothetical protein
MAKLNEKFKNLEKLEKLTPKITSRSIKRKGGRSIIQEEKQYSGNHSSFNTKSKLKSKIESKLK